MSLHSRKRFGSWLPALFDGEFDWDFLAPSFSGTKIMPMDFDAVVERKGNFLVFETKIAGKQIDLGQKITLTSFWKQGGSVIQIAGKSPDSINAYCTYSGWEENKTGDVGDRDLKKGDAFDVVYATRVWFCKASGWEMPTRKKWDGDLWKWDYERNEEKFSH